MKPQPPESLFQEPFSIDDRNFKKVCDLVHGPGIPKPHVHDPLFSFRKKFDELANSESLFGREEKSLVCWLRVIRHFILCYRFHVTSGRLLEQSRGQLAWHVVIIENHSRTKFQRPILGSEGMAKSRRIGEKPPKKGRDLAGHQFPFS